MTDAEQIRELEYSLKIAREIMAVVMPHYWWMEAELIELRKKLAAFQTPIFHEN